MHFWWCGVVCIEALMEESQGIEDEDKEGVAEWATVGVQQAFNKGEVKFSKNLYRQCVCKS